MPATSTASKPSPWPAPLISLPDLIPLGEAAALVKSWTGTKTNPATIWRWTRKGRYGVILPHARIGRSVFTTAAAIEWFVVETTAAAAATASASDGRRNSPETDPASVDAQLDELGI